jgi:ATP-dependent helicase/nuclease subunit A
MTRARQALFISGVDVPEGKSKGISWLVQARAALERAEMHGMPEMGWTGSDQSCDSPPIACRPTLAPAVEAGLAIGNRIAPVGPEADFGILVHAWLEGLTAGQDEAALRTRLALDDATTGNISAMARRILAKSDLAAAFDANQYLRARNELEFLDPAGRVARLDRLVEFESEVWVLDYKTGGLDEPDLLRRAEPHLAQMAGYRQAARALYPGKSVRVVLVFGDGHTHWLEEEPGLGHDSAKPMKQTP